jgi:hypothetical protein
VCGVIAPCYWSNAAKCNTMDTVAEEQIISIVNNIKYFNYRIVSKKFWEELIIYYPSL